MITAIDTSVLLDLFGADPEFGPQSREAVRRCLVEGSIIASEVVWAETTAFFPTPNAGQKAMEGLGVQFVPLDLKSALAAGDLFKEYRSRGGKRDRVIADFLIGAHARQFSQRLLTRDRGFYRSYFKQLRIIEP